MNKESKKTTKSSSNWALLLKKSGVKGATPSSSVKSAHKEHVEEKLNGIISSTKHKIPFQKISEYVGLDCEMVGLGPSGKQSALARACLVDFNGEVIYDKFVRPKGFVTDFRTKYSGVRSSNLRRGEACTFEECQEEVAALLRGKILVGHALKNDMAVLMLNHPRADIRDTACYRPFMRCLKRAGTEKYRPKALKVLAKEVLNLTIQEGEHDPGIDARTAMELYKSRREEWEQDIADAKLLRKQKMKDNNNNSKTKSKKRKEHRVAVNESLFTSLEKSKRLRAVSDIDNSHD